MSPLIRIPLGIAVMILGFFIVKKTDVMLSWFGRNSFAEDKFGQGGSWFFYKLVGVGVIFLGVFIATNIIFDILTSTACILSNCKTK